MKYLVLFCCLAVAVLFARRATKLCNLHMTLFGQPIERVCIGFVLVAMTMVVKITFLAPETWGWALARWIPAFLVALLFFFRYRALYWKRRFVDGQVGDTVQFAVAMMLLFGIMVRPVVVMHADDAPEVVLLVAAIVTCFGLMLFLMEVLDIRMRLNKSTVALETMHKELSV